MSQKSETQEFYVKGMHCAACEMLIESQLSEIEGVAKVDAKLAQGKVYLHANRELQTEELSKLMAESGYTILKDAEEGSQINKREFYTAGLIAGILVLAFILIQKLGVVNLLTADEITLPFVFFIGVVASLSTCMAVVGGLVLSFSANEVQNHKTRSLLVFHISRLIAFFVLGGVIGWLGSAFTLNTTGAFVLNLILFLVMLIMGINLLEIFPAAKRLQFKLPKFLGKNALKLGNKNNVLTPVLLGMVTFILPCGFTQSMQLYSLGTGNFVNGAMTMLVFALGTLPVLAGISFASVKFARSLKSGVFFKTAGLLVIFFAIFNFLASLAAVGLIRPLFNL